ncbi:DUF2971 domain-containing protein, partial [Xanthomonas citri]
SGGITEPFVEVVANQQLDWAERLWRYFKTERFVSLMDTGTLYFASARQFEDRFEGAVAVLPPGFPVDPRYSAPQFYERAFEELRRLTKVSCWHRAEYESDAMWQLYAGSRKGVAVRTTPDRIRAAAQPFRLKPEYGQEDLLAGHVNYADLLKERLNVSMAERFWYKNLAFSWEREFRLAVSMRMAEEFGVAVPEFGIHVEFDLDVLVDKIYLGPSLIDEEIAVIRASADQRGLGDRVRISSLRGQPRYT